MKYALITTAAPEALIRTQEFDSEPPTLAPEKGMAWVPYVEIAATPTATQVRNGYIEGMEAGEWVRRHQVREMTAEEVAAQHVEALRVSDAADMARMVEDILVIVATSGGVSLSRDSFPEAVWSKINARRALRGQEPV